MRNRGPTAEEVMSKVQRMIYAAERTAWISMHARCVEVAERILAGFARTEHVHEQMGAKAVLDALRDMLEKEVKL